MDIWFVSDYHVAIFIFVGEEPTGVAGLSTEIQISNGPSVVVDSGVSVGQSVSPQARMRCVPTNAILGDKRTNRD